MELSNRRTVEWWDDRVGAMDLSNRRMVKRWSLWSCRIVKSRTVEWWSCQIVESSNDEMVVL